MSITPEIELDGNFPECPSCGAEIDTWPTERRAIERERERLIELFQADKFLYEMEIDHVISIIKGEEQ